MQGLPFFAAGDRDDARVRLLLPDQGDARSGVTAAELLAHSMSPPHFPIGPEQLRGDWCFEYLAPGDHCIEGFGVVAAEVPHKGGRTFGFRITDDTTSIAYVPDHLPAPQPSPEVAGLVAQVDLLVHDAQFLAHERAVADLYGHATVDDAILLAEAAGARTLALFHHAPGRVDNDLDTIGRSATASGVDVIVAHEGRVLDLP